MAPLKMNLLQAFSCLLVVHLGASLVTGAPESHNADTGKLDDGLLEIVDQNQVIETVGKLRQNIEAKWEGECRLGSTPGERAEAEGQFLVVALNEVRKFKEQLKASRLSEDKALRKAVEAQVGAAKSNVKAAQPQGWFGRMGFMEDAKKHFADSNFILYGAPASRKGAFDEQNSLMQVADSSDEEGGEGEGAPRDKREAADMRLQEAQTYSDYVKYVELHNSQLKRQKLASIKERTKEFVQSLFVDEVKDLAFILLEQLVARKSTANGVAVQLFKRIQWNFFKYLCGVMSDVFAYMKGCKALPASVRQENPMNWMLHNMID